MGKRKNIIIMSASGLLVAMMLIVGLLAFQGCGYGREMTTLASQDADVSKFFGDQANPISFRKELLLPVSSGKGLDKNEDFIEVWRGVNKTGWIYFVINEPIISRSGYQRICEQFIAAPGPIVEIKSIDSSGVSTRLIDGKEFK